MAFILRSIIIVFFLLPGLALHGQGQPASGPFTPTLALSTGHTAIVNSAQFSPDGKLIVTASIDGTAKVWEAGSGKLLRNLTGGFRRMRSARFNNDGTKILAVSERDTTAIVWEVKTGKLLLRLNGHDRAVWSAQFSPDGTQAVTASSDGTAAL